MSVTGVPAPCGPKRWWRGCGENAGLTARVAELAGQVAGLRRA